MPRPAGCWARPISSPAIWRAPKRSSAGRVNWVRREPTYCRCWPRCSWPLGKHDELMAPECGRSPGGCAGNRAGRAGACAARQGRARGSRQAARTGGDARIPNSAYVRCRACAPAAGKRPDGGGPQGTGTGGWPRARIRSRLEPAGGPRAAATASGSGRAGLYEGAGGGSGQRRRPAEARVAPHPGAADRAGGAGHRGAQETGPAAPRRAFRRRAAPPAEERAGRGEDGVRTVRCATATATRLRCSTWRQSTPSRATRSRRKPMRRSSWRSRRTMPRAATWRRASRCAPATLPVSETLVRPVVAANGEDVVALNTLSAALLAQGKTDEGLDLLARVAELQPDSAMAQTRLGAGLLAAGQGGVGVEHLQQGAGTGSEVPAGGRAAGAESPAQQGDRQGAIKAARGLPAAQSRRGRLPTTCSVAFTSAANETDKARQAFAKALEIAPGDPGASQSLAALAVKDKDYDAARRYYNGVLEKHPDYLPVHMQLAALDFAQGNASRDGRAPAQAHRGASRMRWSRDWCSPATPGAAAGQRGAGPAERTGRGAEKAAAGDVR